MDPAAKSSRRGFLRLLGGETVRGARQLSPLAEQFLPADPKPQSPGTTIAFPTRPREPKRPARAVRRTAGLSELTTIAAELGLAHDRALQRLARFSTRLSIATATGGPVGFAPAGPDSDAGEQGGRCLLAIDCSTLPTEPPLPFFPAEGSLLIFTPSPLPDGPAAHPVRTVHASGAAPAHPDGEALRLSFELMIPRAWSSEVEGLGLSAPERADWEALRLRLAELQGVAPADAQSPDEIVHRLGGYPDERGGDMPLACELGARGLRLDGAPARVHPQAQEFARPAARWRLLAQLSADDRLGWDWGGPNRRMYLWATEEDLDAGRFDQVQSLIR